MQEERSEEVIPYRQLSEFLAYLAEVNRPPFEPAATVVEEMRAQMTSSALAEPNQNHDLASVLTQPDFVGTIVHSEIGISSAQVGDFTMVLILPQRFDEARWDVIAAELVSILDRTPISHNWVVDFSAMNEMPHGIWGAIMACENRLRFRQKDLNICFLKPEIVPESWLPRLKRVFALQLIGGQYFSKKR